MECPSIKPVAVKDLKLYSNGDDAKYVIGAKRNKSRNKTIKELLGKEYASVRYSYYKSKGYYSAQQLIIQHYLNTPDTIAVVYDADFLLENRAPLLKAKNDIVLFENNAFMTYTNYLFDQDAMDNMHNEYNDKWNETVFNRDPSAIFDGKFTLPKNIARELNSERDWKVYNFARSRFNDMMESRNK